MLRRVLAVVVALHGLIHLIGFVVPWRLATLEAFPHSTSAAWGAIELGETGAQVVGLAWLALAVAFVVAAIGLWLRRPWAVPLTAGVAAVSLAACLLGSPASIMGLVIDVAILVAIGAPRTRAGASIAARWVR